MTDLYRETTKPIVVVSRCLTAEPCRYNGQPEKNNFVDKLKDYVEFVSVCPEIDIGLPTPREAIRVVQEKEHLPIKLMQPKTGKDLTSNMTEFAVEFLESLDEVDGFILKNRSPSCGIKEVKIYKGLEKGSASTKGKGLFGGEVVDRFPNIAVEDDGRLKNYKIREHFLTKLYMMKKFRDIKNKRSLEELREFHRNNKLLLMAYNQKQLKILGEILGNSESYNIEKTFKDYEENLGLALARAPRYTSNINVLMRSMGYFKDKISHQEKEFILETIEKYRNGKVPFSAPLYVIKANVIRFQEKNLLNQTFFEPFPYELSDVADSGKGIEK